MAKSKKGKLTIEDALVPVEEQPYQIPENWCWVRLETLGKSFFDGDWILAENMDSEGRVRLLQLSDIGIGEFLDKSDKHISQDTFESLGCSELLAGDVLISRMAEPIARSCIVPQFEYPVITAVDVAVLRCNEHLVLNKYANYLCNAKWFTDKALSLARGTTRTRITRANLGSMAVPLPPLSEQKRIVEQIESLFAKLDEASEKAEIALNNSYDRKNAIFEFAYSGNLTQKWRKNNHYINNVLDEIRKYSLTLAKKEQRNIEECQKTIEEIVLEDGTVWYKTQIGSIGVVTNGSTPSRKCDEYWNGNIPWVSSGEVRNNIISYTREQITELGFENSSVKKLPKGTVLIAMIGEGKTRGQSSVLDIEATTNQNVAAIVIEHGYINPKFLWYWLQKEYKKNREKGAGSGPQALNCQRVRELNFIVPSIEEQNEIVNVLERLMEQEEQSTLSIEKVLEQVVDIKKSILSKAFRGELGTNNPEEESAIELLKGVLEA